MKKLIFFLMLVLALLITVVIFEASYRLVETLGRMLGLCWFADFQAAMVCDRYENTPSIIAQVNSNS